MDNNIPPRSEFSTPRGVDLILKYSIYDPELIKKCGYFLDRWVEKIPFSPIKVFTKETGFVSAIAYSCYKTIVRTQIEERCFEDCEVPYNGESIPQNPLSKHQLDLRAIDFRRYADFNEHEEFVNLKNTARVSICPHCNAQGWHVCPRCNGTRKIDCDRCNGTRFERCDFCNGNGKIKRRTPRYDYYENCPRCSGRGELRCRGCSGRGVVECPKCGGEGKIICVHCEGRGRILEFVRALYRETPVATVRNYIHRELPAFSKVQNPTSCLNGEVVVFQDEMRPIREFSFLRKPASSILSDEVEACRREHSGHIIRQQIQVEHCPIVQYKYKYKGKEHAIYVNPNSGIVEDVAGPIKAFQDGCDYSARIAFKKRKFEKAWYLNLVSHCLDGSTEKEKTLRKAILYTLAWRYFFFVSVFYIISGLLFEWGDIERIKTLWNSAGAYGILWGIFMSLFMPCNVGIYMGGIITRTISSILVGGIGYLSFYSLHCGLEIQAWGIQWIGFCTVCFIFPVWHLIRVKERKRALNIEDHIKEFSNTKALEKYINRFKFRLYISSVGFKMLLGLTLYLGVLLFIVVLTCN